MKALLLHPLTRERLDALAALPPQALLLAGPTGSGKGVLAVSLAEKVLELEPGGLVTYPYQLIVSAGDKSSIGIDAVRDIESFLSLKVPRSAAYNRTVIIEDAQLLTLEAQNALLKTLEEPPAGAFIVLTVTREQDLLPTVRSRLQAVGVKRPAREAIEEHLREGGFDKVAIARAYAISGGLPGLMQALLEQTDHPLLLATERARELLSQPVYERLLLVDELAKQRQLALDVAGILQQMAHVSLQTATGEAAARWQAVLRAGYEAAEALAGNAQPKLALTKLMLSF